MMKFLRRLRLWLFRVPKPPCIDIDLDAIAKPMVPFKPPRTRLTGLSHWKYRDGRLTLICDDCDRAIANSSGMLLQHLCIKGAQQAMHN